jgi:hypothetical protein
MDEKRASPLIFMPMPLFPTSLFLLLLISVLTPTPTLLLPSFLLPPMSNHNARLRRFFGTTTFSQQTLAFCVIGSYPMLGIHLCAFLSSL